MRVARLAPFLAVVYIVATASQGFACKCGSSFHERNPWKLAKLEVTSAAAIFEGVPERFEMRGDVLTAKDGGLISAGLPGSGFADGPHMVVTFRVLRAYKGSVGPEIHVRTGLGGGDCGALFATGLTFLVYAFGSGPADLVVNMCSPGGWVGGKDEAIRLRFLRNQHAIPSDFSPPMAWSDKETPMRRKQRQLDFEENQRAYAFVTGRICGAVIQSNVASPYPARVSFLSAAGYSPFNSADEEIKDDGSFCSRPLGPGKYYLYFEGWSAQEVLSAAYFPGVTDRTAATTVEVAAGQTQAIVFKVPPQTTYSVSGFVSVDDKSDLNEVAVGLLSPDARVRYGKMINLDSMFPLPRVKYFHLPNVLPGHYIAYVQGGRDLYTRKVEVTVTNHDKVISLELLHKK